MNFIRFELEAVPISANRMYKAVARQFREPGQGDRKISEEYKQWRNLASVEVMAQRPSWQTKKIIGTFGIAAIWPYNGRRDLDNYWKPLLDMLQHMDVIENDKLCITQRAYKQRGITKGKIFLIQMSEDDIRLEIEKIFGKTE